MRRVTAAGLSLALILGVAPQSVAAEPPEQVDPEFEEIKDLFYRGSASFSASNYDAAIELAPAFAWSWHARGMAQHNLNRFQDAIADYSKAIELDPNHFKAVEWRGFNKAILGDHLGAWLDFTRAPKLEGDGREAAPRESGRIRQGSRRGAPT